MRQLAGTGAPGLPRSRTGGADDGLPGPERFAPAASEARFSRAELLQAAGLEERQLGELESYGLLAPGPAGSYDGDALVVARAAMGLARYGVEPRHLRSYKAAADREVGLVRQIVLPLRGRPGAESRARADDATRQIAALSVRLHAALVSAGLGRV